MNRYLKWLLPLLAIVLIAPFTPAIDLNISRYFYSDGHFFDNLFTKWMYRFGERLGFVVAGTICLIYVMTFFRATWKKWRPALMTLMLTWFLGAGLIINTTLKEYWPRARPKQVIEFGGKHPFQPFYKPDFVSRGEKKSFPSGHVAVGFYYLSFLMVGVRENRKWLIYSGLYTTLFFGFSLFFTRVAQGGHFFSDALFSIAVMWWTALLSEWIAYDLLNVKKTLPELKK